MSKSLKRQATDLNSESDSDLSSADELPILNLSSDDSSDESSNGNEDADPPAASTNTEDLSDVPSLEGFNSSEAEDFSESEVSDSQLISDDEIVEGADGNPRVIRPEIDPHYSSDDSDQEDQNPIGNIPISAYDKFPHIGYSIDGKRIMRPATKGAIDSLLESIDMPKGWTGLIDKNTGQSLNLSNEEIELIDRVQRGLLPNDDINPFEDQVEWVSNQREIMPLSATNEPKRRFVPSKHEAKTVAKLVKAIREGRLSLRKRVPDDEDVDDDDRQMMLNKKLYDVWEREEQVVNRMHLPAPKLPPPTHEESYNPPKEYLFTEEEKKKWEEMDPEDRETNFVPQSFGSLRKVPGYANAIRERFERCLDLYLAPRGRSKRSNINPEDLLPDLPSPEDLKPFPIKCSTVYTGHEGLVRSVSIDLSGNYLATGGQDGTVRVWEVLTGRELYRIDLLALDTYSKDEDASGAHPEDQIYKVEWHPTQLLLAVAAGDNIYLVVPPILTTKESAAYELLERGWTYHAAEMERQAKMASEEPIKKYSEWAKPPAKLEQRGCALVIRCSHAAKTLSWHSKGDYFVSTHPDAKNSAVLVHQISKHSTQSPFRKSKGLIQQAMFHPLKPHLYVASQRYVRIYDLISQSMIKRLMPGVKWLSSFDIHPMGDNVLAGSYDLRVVWHDMDLSDRPYKTLRYHERAVRDVKFHKKLPLFCSASDDGSVNVLHSTVYDDAGKNPMLVPLKILKGHKKVGGLGVISSVWHPREAWLFTCGADGTARLWTT